MLEQEIFTIRSSEEFENKALEVFQYQYANTPVYRRFCDLLGTKPPQVQSLEGIPFLPIQFFKEHDIIAKGQSAEITFTSSGTTGSTPSRHQVADPEIYRQSFLQGFRQFYGDPSEYTILALLPSYLERSGSSLIYMVDALIKESSNSQSGFYLYNTDELLEILKLLESRSKKTLLIGVSFALLDLVEEHSLMLNHTYVMETGGMKGRRKELIREELHSVLMEGFGVEAIHSEYGMTELLSQAYSTGKGMFRSPPWMRVLTRNTENPLEWVHGTTGGINVIDLANIYSCSFIATQDLGKVHSDGSFEILGRFDTSDIRGCNLMVL